MDKENIKDRQSRYRATQPRFIVDTMLGEVARWLRILGYDTLYSKTFSDRQIVSIAEKTGRIILTRDRGLFIRARKKGIRAVYVSSHDIAGRLAELVVALGLRLVADPSKSRCSECNSPLIQVRDKEKVRDRVPPKALETYDVFYICPRCGRVYWEGGHWKNIRRIIREALELAEVMKYARKRPTRRPRRGHR
ncbi:MAG: Mut7-C RNAse domain-containing protein [Desulfurococcales archaeon]|nr:Mut7-C RNAse domain-containing protein [Desulfurococcales archaeon]